VARGEFEHDPAARVVGEGGGERVQVGCVVGDVVADHDVGRWCV
jgi:hypothetical protein